LTIRKPNTKLNIAASRKVTEKKSLFVDVPNDGSVQVRHLPPDNDDGILFVRIGQHFKFEDEDGNSRAYACLNEHGGPDDGKCAICDTCEYFKKNGNDVERDIADGFKGVGLSYQFYAQVYDKNRIDEGPKLIRVPQSAADQFMDKAQFAEDNGMPVPSDVEAGEWVIYGKKIKNKRTEWSVMPTGVRVPLDTLDKDWAEKMMDITEALALRILPRVQQIKALKENYGSKLELEKVFKATELKAA